MRLTLTEISTAAGCLGIAFAVLAVGAIALWMLWTLVVAVGGA